MPSYCSSLQGILPFNNLTLILLTVGPPFPPHLQLLKPQVCFTGGVYTVVACLVIYMEPTALKEKATGVTGT